MPKYQLVYGAVKIFKFNGSLSENDYKWDHHIHIYWANLLTKRTSPIFILHRGRGNRFN